MPIRQKRRQIDLAGGSTAPWDQPIQSTTITHWENDPVPEILNQEGVVVHSRVPTIRHNLGRREHGTIMLVSRKNIDYKQS